MSLQRPQALLLASIALVALLALSGAQPYDRATWALEVFPVVIALPVMWATYRRFPLTTLLYVCIFLHALVHRWEVRTRMQESLLASTSPIFSISVAIHTTRLVTSSRALSPLFVAREIFIRGSFVRGTKMLAFIVICVVMAISAVYELIEWAVAIAIGQGANEFLGTQGDPMGHSIRYVSRAHRCSSPTCYCFRVFMIAKLKSFRQKRMQTDHSWDGGQGTGYLRGFRGEWHLL